MSFIKQLRDVLPGKRVELIRRRYEKNRNFIKAQYPALDSFLENHESPYEINLTEHFFSIKHRDNDEPCHPEPLDHFAEALGDWSHETWLDFTNLQIQLPAKEYPLHYSLTKQFFSGLQTALPDFEKRFISRQIDLKQLADGNKYSPSVAFVGIFHGLHIEHYLSRTQLDRALFIEPEPDRFEVSCYFLDWENIADKFGSLCLVIGSDPNVQPINDFFMFGRVVPMVWLRVLPGYVSPENGRIISTLHLLHNNANKMFTPLDVDLESMKNGLRNVGNGHLLLSKKIELSSESKIVVVGAGPSLHNDLRWIKKNRENLIVFAVHSAVVPLREAGVRPDFQFALELHLQTDVLAQLQLAPDIPLVLSYQTSGNMIRCTNMPYLVALAERSNDIKPVVKIKNGIP